MVKRVATILKRLVFEYTSILIKWLSTTSHGFFPIYITWDNFCLSLFPFWHSIKARTNHAKVALLTKTFTLLSLMIPLSAISISMVQKNSMNFEKLSKRANCINYYIMKSARRRSIIASDGTFINNFSMILQKLSPWISVSRWRRDSLVPWPSTSAANCFSTTFRRIKVIDRNQQNGSVDSTLSDMWEHHICPQCTSSLNSSFRWCLLLMQAS